MRAVLVEYADPPFRVAEGDQIFAQQAHASGIAVGLGELTREHRWQPILAQHAAHWRLGSNATQAVVLFLTQHGSSVAATDDEERWPVDWKPAPGARIVGLS